MLVQYSERLIGLTSGRRFCPFDAPDSSGGHKKQGLRLGLHLHCAEGLPSLPIRLSESFGRHSEIN